MSGLTPNAAWQELVTSLVREWLVSTLYGARFRHVCAGLQVPARLSTGTVIKSGLGINPDFRLPTPREAELCPVAEEPGELRDQLRVKADNQKREPEDNAGTVESATC